MRGGPDNRRFHDPLRAVARRVREGAGSDVLLMDCGHEITVDHRPVHPKRKRCHGCRMWVKELQP